MKKSRFTEEQIVGILRDVCHSGQSGDGVLWVTPVDMFHRLREFGGASDAG